MKFIFTMIFEICKVSASHWVAIIEGVFVNGMLYGEVKLLDVMEGKK